MTDFPTAGRTTPTATSSSIDTLSPQAEARLMEFTKSELFTRTFKEGMDLVEETAAYLDGKGREDSKALPREDALVYATQSMKLTTRLMQVASWLLVQRALKDQDMTTQEARAEKYRLAPEGLKGEGRQGLADIAHSLPAVLLDLIARSEALYLRILRLDRSLYGAIAAQSGNTVADQMSRIESAFRR